MSITKRRSSISYYRFSRPISTKIHSISLTRFQIHAIFSSSIKLEFLFRYYSIQFRFRAPMISLLSFHFVNRHSRLQDRHSYVEYIPPFRNRCNQIQSHRSVQDFVAVVFFFFIYGQRISTFEHSTSTQVGPMIRLI